MFLYLFAFLCLFIYLYLLISGTAASLINFSSLKIGGRSFWCCFDTFSMANRDPVCGEISCVYRR